MVEGRNLAVRGVVGDADVVKGDRRVLGNRGAGTRLVDLLDRQDLLQTQRCTTSLLVHPRRASKHLDGARQHEGDKGAGENIGDTHPTGPGHE